MNLGAFKMRKIKDGLLYLMRSWFRFLFIRYTKKHRSREIFLFDLDNTLADTWPCYFIHYDSYSDKLKSLPVFLGVYQKVMALQSAGHPVFFITARNYTGYSATIAWLKSIRIRASIANVIIVNSTEEKLALIKKAVQYHPQITYFDDLSYNHEHGETKYYISTISEFNKLPISYFDKSMIDRINRSEN